MVASLVWMVLGHLPLEMTSWENPSLKGYWKLKLLCKRIAEWNTFFANYTQNAAIDTYFMGGHILNGKFDYFRDYPRIKMQK